MDKSPATLVMLTAVIATLGFLISLAGGQNGAVVHLSILEMWVSVFMVCGILAFLINWLCFIPAAIFKTEHYYDIVGSFTSISLIVTALCFSSSVNLRGVIVGLMVVVWALRLGVFLFIRVRKVGRDDRFDQVKINPFKFLLAWTLQAFWVLMSLACALVVITSNHSHPIGFFAIVGFGLWVTGFIIEVVADYQKSQFKKDPANKGKFISNGLWAWSQHPNYFGEIVLWFGIAIASIPVLQGWQWVVLLSPFFVFILLTRGSGIPTLKEKADRLWGNDPDYLNYISRTTLLFLKKPRR